ncbi:TetR family transcriptional regulator [Sulfuricella sp. T08]|uniref:TetR/AcrR family transcriptional regulator n=1 Tax=Sulfuricella sp. T08 TaxID=1632857 RepID=UPI0006179D72|nr:TetR/AcrR family transcriptional regulator [Sulfuricella sp. T08]GAO35936.1 TetR family transcriptional regulator [Sulfuricella sp. T08]
MQTKQPDLTRDKILQSAFCEIHRQGFQAASIANILQDTGLTKGALYHHFPTKKVLGLAVIEEIIKERLEGLIFKPLRESERPIEMLLEIIATIDKKVPSDFVMLGCPLNNLMQEMSPLDELFQERLAGVLGVWQKTVEGALKRGQKQGEIRAEVDYKAAALFVVSAWEGCIGVAKNMRSPKAFGTCMKQLHGYVQGLMPAKVEKGRRKGA